MRKKVTTLIYVFLYVGGIICESIAGIDPYSFYPSGTYKPDEMMFRPVRELVDRNPLRPLVVTDKNGNKSYVTSQGDVMVKVDKNGNKTFMIKGRRSHMREFDGDLSKKWEYERGSAMVEVKDEFGDTVSMEQQGLGGRVVAEYDPEGHLSKSYKYNKYGKRMEWVVDELTQARVKYGFNGQPTHDVDADGNKIATYKYDETGRLEYREDVYGNRTHYDKKGNRTKTVAKDGYLMVTYNYKKNSDGYYEVESVKDELTGNITLYEDGKQRDVRNYNGLLIRQYKWQGTQLIFTEDFVTGEVSWYDQGRPKYMTLKGERVKEWVYFEGKLMGIWDEFKNLFDLYSHGEKALQLYMDQRPEVKDLLDKYNSYGLEI